MSTGPYGALLDAVRGVRWPAARRVNGATLGAHPSQLRGNSSEFSEFRLYRQGDDPRRLDWRLLARSDRAYVRLTTDRATLRTTIIADASASMAYPLPDLAKWRLAREIAVGLAAVAHADADPVGLSIASPSSLVLAPRARRSVLLEMMKGLDATKPAGTADLAPLVAGARANRIVIISDLLSGVDEMLVAARLRIAAKAEIIVVHIIADEELDPPRDAMLAVDPEQPAVRRVLDDDLRDAYKSNLTRFLQDTAERLRSCGVRYVLAQTSEPAAHVIRRLTGMSVRVGG